MRCDRNMVRVSTHLVLVNQECGKLYFHLNKMKKAFKYIPIIFVNFSILLLLSKLWIDPFEQALNNNTLFNEVAKIIGFSVLSLIGLLILSRIMRKRQVQLFNRKLIYSIVLTLLICSYLYTDYTIKIINNCLINNNTRSELLRKTVINNINATTFIFAQNLTELEYNQFARTLDIPKLNRSAYNIDLNYNDTRSLMHEFSTQIKYDLPKDIGVKEFNYQSDKSDYQKNQTVEQIGNIQKVAFVKSWW